MRLKPALQVPSGDRLHEVGRYGIQEAKNWPNVPSQEKFHRGSLNNGMKFLLDGAKYGISCLLIHDGGGPVRLHGNVSESIPPARLVGQEAKNMLFAPHRRNFIP